MSPVGVAKVTSALDSWRNGTPKRYTHRVRGRNLLLMRKAFWAHALVASKNGTSVYSYSKG